MPLYLHYKWHRTCTSGPLYFSQALSSSFDWMIDWTLYRGRYIICWTNDLQLYSSSDVNIFTSSDRLFEISPSKFPSTKRSTSLTKFEPMQLRFQPMISLWAIGWFGKQVIFTLKCFGNFGSCLVMSIAFLTKQHQPSRDIALLHHLGITVTWIFFNFKHYWT